MKYPSYTIRLKQEQKDELKKIRKKVPKSVEIWLEELRKRLI